jgi:hypothetical protein
MIDKITRDLIDKIVIELNKEDNKEKLEEKIINPILHNFTSKLFPYISLLFIMYSFNIILIISIIILILNNNKII